MKEVGKEVKVVLFSPRQSLVRDVNAADILELKGMVRGSSSINRTTGAFCLE